jgi:hypothetical protein
MEASSMTICPLCSHPSREGVEECPTCGVIFAKLRARAEREKAAAAHLLEATPAPALRPWHVRLAAVALVAGWMLGLGIYYRVELRRNPPRHKSAAMQGRSSVVVRDAYGLIGEVPVTSARPGSSRREEPPPPPEPESSKPDPFDE